MWNGIERNSYCSNVSVPLDCKQGEKQQNRSKYHFLAKFVARKKTIRKPSKNYQKTMGPNLPQRISEAVAFAQSSACASEGRTRCDHGHDIQRRQLFNFKEDGSSGRFVWPGRGTPVDHKRAPAHSHHTPLRFQTQRNQIDRKTIQTPSETPPEKTIKQI